MFAVSDGPAVTADSPAAVVAAGSLDSNAAVPEAPACSAGAAEVATRTASAFVGRRRSAKAAFATFELVRAPPELRAIPDRGYGDLVGSGDEAADDELDKRVDDDSPVDDPRAGDDAVDADSDGEPGADAAESAEAGPLESEGSATATAGHVATATPNPTATAHPLASDAHLAESTTASSGCPPAHCGQGEFMVEHHQPRAAGG